MDKKNLILGALTMTAAIVLMIWSSVDQQHRAAALAQWRLDHPDLVAATGNLTATGATGNLTGAPSASLSAPASNGSDSTAPAATPAVTLPEAAPTTPAKTARLENDDIVVTFTEDGGAIQSVALKKFLAHLNQPGPVIFNDGVAEPALALKAAPPVKPDENASYWSWNWTAWSWSSWAWAGNTGSAVGNPNVPPAPVLQRYTLDTAASNATTTVFHGQTADGLEITRTYSLSPDANNSYLIQHTTTFTNHGSKAVSLARIFVNAGTAPPTADGGSIASYYMNFGFYFGANAEFISPGDFAASAGGLGGLVAAHAKRDFIYAGREGPPDLKWASVKDQFFAAVLTPKDVLGSGVFSRSVSVLMDGVPQTTVTGDLELNLGLLPAGQEKKLECSYFVGPKELLRLDRLGQGQDLIMQFGRFGFISKILLVAIIGLQSALHHIAPRDSWGWAIIAFTIAVKLLTWPLTAQQVRMSKRMAQLQKPLAALKEKYKDKPEKLQAETMELWRKHKVNPFTGCISAFIQIPIFFGLSAMLRTASELRFASFLWIQNLSSPDTIAHIAGVPINLLPVLYTSCNFLQMRMIPSPTTDDTQRKIMQFMPLMFFFTFYAMPSGLVLYFTCQSILTILQQKLTRMSMDAGTTGTAATPIIAPVGPSARRK